MLVLWVRFKRIPFGNIDGEGCERFWSYLDKFVSMTRTMGAGNRKLLLLEAVNHLKTKKMAIMRKFDFIYSFNNVCFKKCTHEIT